MSTFSAYSENGRQLLSYLSCLHHLRPSNSDGTLPKGSALPDMYRLLSIQVCSRGIWTLLFPHTLARSGTETAERLSLRHNNTLGQDKEIASLKRQMLVQLLSGQSRGLSVYYQEPPFALFCFVAATIKPPVDSLWSKSFHLLFKEKSDGQTVHSFRVYCSLSYWNKSEPSGVDFACPHNGMWRDTRGDSSHLKQLCKLLTV